jgi:hypothetical protein
MEKDLAEKLVEMLNDEGDEAAVYEGYSGRGMYGKTTTGVVCSNFGMLLAVCICHADELVDDTDGLAEVLFSPTEFSTDSMGTDLIIY